MMEPISVCELEFGMPKYQVARFQMMAATSRAKIMAKAGAASDTENQLDRQERNHSEGNRARGSEHADKVPSARPNHRNVRLKGMCINNGCDGICGVVKAIHEFKSQSYNKGNPEQHVRQG